MQITQTETETKGTNLLQPHEWVDKYGDYLYSFAMVRLNDKELARDLVQETFLAALERKEKFEGRSSEKTWLTAILKNKIIDRYRSKSSGLLKSDAREAEEKDIDFFDKDDGHWNDQHRPAIMGIEQPDALENKEFQKILQACMRKLPMLWHTVFTMKHLDDESTEMICRELKVSSSNYWVIIHRTKVNLRSCLQKNWL